MEACDPVIEPALIRYGKATLSDDGMYRYVLSRDTHLLLPSTKRVCWICLNPSSADALVDDASIRKMKGFTARWGYSALDVVNVFAYRTKSPKVLEDAPLRGVDIIGLENDFYIARTIAGASMVVCAWGADPIVSKLRKLGMKTHLRAAPSGVVALKLTQAGAPWHPLYAPYDKGPVSFTLEA
jgi:hypothetical protein